MARKPANRDSIFHEPHLRPPAPAPQNRDAPLDSVWMEPIHHPAGSEKGSDPYAVWLRREKSLHRSGLAWARAFGMALLAGPLAVASALLTRHPGMGLLVVVVAGPLIEEIGKILLPLMVMERNPARFTHRLQLILCAVASGLVFACVENLLYLRVYIPDPGALLITWRWTVCVALHSGCSLLAGMGLAKIWHRARQTESPPRMETGLPLILTAVVIHGAYNLFAVLINPWFD